MAFACHACRTAVELDPRNPLGRSFGCPHCGADLRCCLNCRHYDPNVRYECREHVPERVGDKTKGNFCDGFQPRDWTPAAGGPTPVSSADAARQALEALFKKK